LDEAQINEAIDQVRIDCKILTETDYHVVSMRGELYKLGYNSEQAEEVLQYVASKGFDYCLDPSIGSDSHFLSEKGKKEFPNESVCYWGPDQLESRLRSL
jgi:hypothetical protein